MVDEAAVIEQFLGWLGACGLLIDFCKPSGGSHSSGQSALGEDCLACTVPAGLLCGPCLGTMASATWTCIPRAKIERAVLVMGQFDGVMGLLGRPQPLLS